MYFPLSTLTLSIVGVCLFATICKTEGSKILKIQLKKSRSLIQSLDQVKSRKYFTSPEVLETDDVSTVTVPLTNGDFDLYYYGLVKVGTPGQPLNVMIDTGSTDFWVTSSQSCKYWPESEFTCPCGHVTYDHSRSSTYKEHGDVWHAIYGTDKKLSYSGFISEDNIEVEGRKIYGQTFAEATIFDIKKRCVDKFDGLIGLGFPHTTTVDILKDTLLLNMVNQGVIDQPVFAFYMTRSVMFLPEDRKNVSDSDIPQAELVLGGYDPDHFTGNITYAPLADDGVWAVTVETIFFGDQSLQQDLVAIVDSGSSIISVPLSIMNYMKEAFKNIISIHIHNVEFIDCSDVNNLPDITFVIQNTEFVLRPEDYITKVSSKYENSFQCLIGIDYHNEERIILGDVFMRKYYSVFDMTNKRIGFATAK